MHTDCGPARSHLSILFGDSLLLKVIAIVVLIVLLCRSDAISQDFQGHKAQIDFIRLFQSLHQDLPRERLHLHTDRQWYYSDDLIWFSAYVVAGEHHIFSGISSVLYVELIEPDGSIAERVAVKLENGRGEGVLSLTNALAQSGTFRIRSYTVWALNFGDSYTFTQDITVISEEIKESAHIQKDEIDLQFLPEGGHLVDGIPTRLAYKAIGTDGFGLDVSGTIFDREGNEITDFRSTHLGKGIVDFMPYAGTEYYAVVNGQNFDLPRTLSSGVVMNIHPDEGFFEVHIRATGISIESEYILFAHVRGNVYYVSPVPVNEEKETIFIPRSLLASGIVHFTLLSPEAKPVAERLAFNKNEVDKLQVEVGIDEEPLGLRSEVVINVELLDFEQKVLGGTASISVYDDNIIEYDPYATDIVARLNLEAEVKGYIEQPGFYFSDDENADDYLDLLLLTQGWRAYDMTDIPNIENIAVTSLPEDGFTISGKVLSGWFARPLEDATVVLSIGEDHEHMEIVTTDENGRFIFSGLEIYGPKIITLRANTQRGGDNVRLRIDEQFKHIPEDHEPVRQHAIAYTSEPVYEEELPVAVSPGERARTSTELNLEQFFYFGEMEEVVITAEREPVDWLDAALRDRVRTGQLHQIDLDEAEHLNSLPLSVVVSQLPGVRVVGNELSIRTGSMSSARPVIILDGMIFEDGFDLLLHLPTSDVKSVQVLRRIDEVSILGARGAGGALVIRTRRGGGITPREKRGLITAYFEGYQQSVRFYSPRYGVNLPVDYQNPDTRITLHWDPNIEIPPGNVKVRFWTNDISSIYRVVLQGITETGIPFSATRTFKVRDNL